jgi:hypothetical protein
MRNDAGRLARSARILRWLSWLGIALVMAAMLLGIWALVYGPMSGGGVTFQVDTGGLDPPAAAAVLVVAGTLLVLALLQIVAMLRAVEAGAPFRTAARLRGFAFYLFLALLAADVLPTLVQLVRHVVLGWPGSIDFDIGGEELLILFVTGLLFLVARLLDAAQRLADEHEQIV